MNTIRVSTTQHIDIEYDVAGLGERIAARLIDMGLFLVLYLAGLVLALGLASSGTSKVTPVVLLIIYAALYVFYDLVCEVFFNGQSVGKRAMKIKVISLDGAQPAIGQYLLRWLFRIVDFLLTSGIGAIISVAVTPNKQRIGDIVANTTLVKTTPRTDFSAVAFRPVVETDYQPVFPSVGQLLDEDINLVHDVLQNYRKSGNILLVSQMAGKLKEHLRLEVPEKMNEMQLLHTIIKDYNFVTSTTA